MLAATTHLLIKAMWLGGPSHIWSPTRQSGASLPAAAEGFLGAYVSQQCKKPCPGVLRISQGLEAADKWLCGGCRNNVAGQSA